MVTVTFSFITLTTLDSLSPRISSQVHLLGTDNVFNRVEIQIYKFITLLHIFHTFIISQSSINRLIKSSETLSPHLHITMSETAKQVTHLESNHVTKLTFDTLKTAYLCVENGSTFFSVHNSVTETITPYGSFTLEHLIEVPETKEQTVDDLDSDDSGDEIKGVPAKYYDLTEVHEIYPDTLLVLFGKSETYFVTKEKATLTDRLIYNSLRDQFLKHSFSVKLNGLSQVRKNGEFDFSLKTSSSSIPVHSLILKSNWPYFKAVIDSKMSESENKQLEINYPASWVEAMVSYFYGEPFDVNFDNATGLLILSDVYDIPELQHLAVARIKKEELDMTKCLNGWKNAFEAQNTDMREYFGKYVREKLVDLDKSRNLLKEMTQEEAVELMLDVSRVQLEGLEM